MRKPSITIKCTLYVLWHICRVPHKEGI